MSVPGWRAALAAALAAGVGAQEPRVLLPVSEVRVENGRVFAESVYSPLLRGLATLAADRLTVSGRDRDVLAAAWKGLHWPVVVQVAYDREQETPVAALWSPLAGSPLLGTIAVLAAESGEELQPVSIEDEHWRRLRIRGRELDVLVLEGVVAGRRLLVVTAAEPAPDAPALIAGLTRLEVRDTPARRALLRHAEGGDLGWIVDARALVSGADRDELAAIVAVLRLVFGPRFAGVAGNLRVADGGLELELFADLRPTRGLVGSLARDEPRPLDVLGWLPEMRTDHVAVDVSVDGAVRLLNTWGSFGAEFAELVRELGWPGTLDVEALTDTHLTGQVLVAGAEPAAGEALEPVLVVVGAWDGGALLADLRASLGGLETVSVAAVPDLGGDAFAVRRGGAVVLHLAAEDDVLMACGPDRGSTELLLASRQTDGARPVPAAATVLGRGHLLDRLHEWSAELRDLGAADDLGTRLRALVEDFVAEHDREASWRLVVGAEGSVLRVGF